MDKAYRPNPSLFFTLFFCACITLAQGQIYFIKNASARRGVNVNVVWPENLGGSKTIKFELAKGGQKYWEKSNVENTGISAVQFPASLKPGKDYVFSILTEEGESLKSESLTIRRRIPLGVWFSPVVITGIILLALPKEERLPLPPEPILPN